MARNSAASAAHGGGSKSDRAGKASADARAARGSTHSAMRSGAGIFAASVCLMALKPVLLHLGKASSSENSAAPLPPAKMQVYVEVVKVTICLVALGVRHARGLTATLWCGVAHTLPFSIPAGIYMIMNLITIVAARMLTPPSFQLLANMKILATAVVSRLILGRGITRTQWYALVVLTGGVTLGQMSGTHAFEAPLIGVALMMVCSSLSAVGAVCTELLLKSKESASLSIVATNIHMAAHTLLLNSVAAGLVVG
eukprot:TRINITY_DN8342_c0_g1_i1.p1 TRINITY_DN8342_c0_g1~~TRINITY_DN8342_c0_g1_i1.p1  ORF type:complete len:266 (-),score=29.14 TRINITY_DN8342_c0_g1_i1:371-1135(-)